MSTGEVCGLARFGSLSGMLNMEVNIDPSDLQPLGEYDFEKNFNHLAARKWMEENCIIAACRVWKQMAFLLLILYVYNCFAFTRRFSFTGDTVFIVLRKKKLIFLHWYHHFSTVILSWYGYKMMATGMGWNAALNLSIHSVVYSYYTVTDMGFQVPKPIMMLITTSQIVQMAGFVQISIFSIFWKNDKSCQITWPMILLSFFFYTTLLALFYNFFVKTYLSSTQKSKWN